ncbi:DotH/IcmK family type IV secretion protein [Ferrimonas marina]|uniref:Putative outer membrane core complex of type IVb secretion n=1 Tax=Ferrimonas marina TaxID=299255 RepID=A0A1M5TJT4_9GAMM|nr:DotH/IcmK family type IV secretion protein [Ferrimonas marina]SHH51065.1 Putative outer membrane core complex of type IVb secretion [Ferrimonas marina]
MSPLTKKTLALAVAPTLLASTFAIAEGLTLEEALAKHSADKEAARQREMLSGNQSSSSRGNGQANPVDVGGPSIHDAAPPSGDEPQGLLKGYVQITLADGQTVYMTEKELLALQAKQDKVLKHIHQQNELRPVLDALDRQTQEAAFDNAQKEKYPLTPEQIIELRKLEQRNNQARNAPVKDIRQEISTVAIDVDAADPIDIRVKNGYSASIVFFDQAGAPWPIDGDLIGNQEAFTKQVTGQNLNVASFNIRNDFAESNVLLHLLDFDMPLVLRLVGSGDVVDARKSVRIPKLGPQSKANEGNTMSSGGGTEHITDDMLAVLNGDRLPGSKRYRVNGIANTTVLVKDGFMYVRTTADLLLPHHIEDAHSISGFSAYKTYPNTSLLFSVNGERVQATVSEQFESEIKYKKSIFN